MGRKTVAISTSLVTASSVATQEERCQTFAELWRQYFSDDVLLVTIFHLRVVAKPLPHYAPKYSTIAKREGRSHRRHRDWDSSDGAGTMAVDEKIKRNSKCRKKEKKPTWAMATAGAAALRKGEGDSMSGRMATEGAEREEERKERKGDGCAI
ncbi:conserved hypothetical protein [Ricinus communis]|uniref:Uncharacterized protein n=1 Tax=Ricinus communis TaxID=3988 RepID=B9RPV2_RICCO|nr:conserved hypothetical protein [Ricinus communis]